MLRVFLPGPPRADRADVWVRYAADGRAIARGTDVPANWPPDGVIEAVLAADQCGLIALALPPMPRDRIRAAARFALEDRLASPADDVAIGVTRAGSGGALAAVASASIIRAIADGERRIRKLVPESALAPYRSGWTWCTSAAGNGFVRRADGSTFGVSDSIAGVLPAELDGALAQAAHANAAPAAVNVAFATDATELARWSRAGGVSFVAAPPWRWESANAAAFEAAPDFLERQPDATAESHGRAFHPALALAATAAILYFAGLVVQWAALRFEDWRLSHAIIAEAAAQSLPDAATPDAAASAIARQNARLHHRAAQSALGDALPLLARAAPALSALPSGAIRSARYASDAWTLETGKLDAATRSRMARALAAAGVETLIASSAAGERMRLSLAATAR